MNIGGVKGYVYTETVEDGTNGEAVIVTPLANASGRITCAIVSTGNTGKVQITTSSVAAVGAGTATWLDWAQGDVTTTTTDVLTGPVTAVRGVSVTGVVVFELVI